MRNAVFVFLALSVWAAAGFASKVEVARSADVDYSAYSTFEVRAKEGIGEDHPLSAGTPIFDTLAAAARQTLAKSDMTAVADSPDIWITFYAVLQDEMTVTGTTANVGAVTWIGAPGAHSMRTALEGVLIVEAFDAATGERIWSGWASEVAKDRAKLRKKAAKVATRILQEFPRE